MASPANRNGHAPKASVTSALEEATIKVQLAVGDEGDVVVVCKTPFRFELVVSAKVLSNASPDLKKMLATQVSHQIPRSSKNPQKLEMSKDVSGADTKLLCALWHGRQPVLDLLMRPPGSAILADHFSLIALHQMVILAKKFCAIESLRESILPVLESFAKRAPQDTPKQDKLTCIRDTRLAMIAYLLEQEELFAIFTRRMILDHYVYLSELGPEVLKQFPPMALLHLEEQRIAAKPLIDNFLKTVSKRTCSFCPNAKNDPSITTAIGDRLIPKLLMWPPNYTKDHSLRQVITAIQSFEDSEAISLETEETDE